MKVFINFLYLLLIQNFIFISVCQFVPDPRYEQTSTLVDNKIYFFGGSTRKPNYTNEVVYLDLSTLFNATWPLWVKNPMGIPSKEILASSCLSSIDNSTVFLIGGLSLDQTNQKIINPLLVYSFNSKTSQWNTVKTTGFYNYSVTLIRMNAVMNDDGNIYIFGGIQVNYTVKSTTHGSYLNKMNVFNTKTLTWSSLNLITNVPTPRASYTATLLNNSLIIYIGGLSKNKININMNEQTIGDTITARNAHSAVLTQDGRIIIFGGSSANSSTRTTTLRAYPDVAVLNTNVSPYKWSIPNISSANSPQSLCYHSAEIYKNIMIIAFGIITSDQLQTSAPLNKNIYLFNVQNYAWISSNTSTSIPPTSKETGSNNQSNDMTIGISVGISGFIFILSLIIGFSYYRHRKLKKNIIEIPGTDYYLTEISNNEKF
ncbi:galactose oxidase [Gigaspora margarita]|uniref:Galactose oxidase n=1 Tax=Gigaspora margarita TaxID=4874 RepID=A0A8H3X1G6_GIGMA|nr:galactose oxidase [Gigaspora margarita]